MLGPYRHDIHIDGNISQKLTEHTLFMAVHYAYAMDVKGHIVEFGTMTGSSAAALAAGMKTLDGHRHTRTLYLCDSFEGLPVSKAPEDMKSPHVADGTWHPGQCVDRGADDLREYMADIIPREKVRIVPGWFKDTAKRLEGPFAVIHVDCDLYQSTMDALVPLFERHFVSDGAMILFDDWNCNRADPRYGERAAWKELCRRFEIEASDEGGYGIAGHKFIVHAYRQN